MATRPPSRGAALRAPMQEAGRRLLRWGFLAETWGELRKVSWPSREETVRLTGMVIAVSAVVAAFLGILDFIYTVLVRFIL